MRSSPLQSLCTRTSSPHQDITTETQKTTAERLHAGQIHCRPYSDAEPCVSDQACTVAHRKSTYAAYVDLKSAFDSLSRPALWLLLQSIGIPQKIINLMAALDTDSSSCVRVNGELSDFFTFFTGVRQGCVLAPDSFDTAMDWILGHTVPRSVPGVSIGPDYFTDLDYADDVALLVELLNLPEPALLNFSDEASKLGLQVNWKKTVVKSLNDARECPSSITVGSVQWRASTSLLTWAQK